MSEFIGQRRGVDTSQFLAGPANVEQPLDPGSFGVSSPLPACQFMAQSVAVGDAPVQTLLDQHPDTECDQGIDALRKFPLAIEVDTDCGPVGIVHAGAVERSWTRTTEGFRDRHRQTIGTALLGGDDPRWRGTPGSPVSGVWPLATGHFVRRRAWFDGAW